MNADDRNLLLVDMNHTVQALVHHFKQSCKSNIVIQHHFVRCSIPDDHIDPRRWALFAARWVLGDSRKEKRHARTTA
jgi:hypothetical protein